MSPLIVKNFLTLIHVFIENISHQQYSVKTRGETMKVTSIVFAFAVSGSISTAHAELPYADDAFGCITREEADAFVDDFGINVSSFGGMELCNSNVDTKKLFNDLQLIKEGKFNGNKTNMFINNWVNRDGYYNWAQSMTRGIRRGHDIPYATAYNSFGYFTMQDGWAKLSTLGRVGTLIHEARHTAGYGHVSCDQGPYKGAFLSGCDDTLDEGGSHGVEMEYYSRVILQGENFHPVYQQMARLMNLGRANFVFNDVPLKPTEGIVAMTNREFVIMSPGAQAVTKPLPAIQNAQLKRTSSGAALFTGDQAFAIDLAGNTQTSIVDDYSYFKMLLDRRLTGVTDMEEFDINNRRYLVALTNRGQLHSYIYSEGKWSAPTNANDIARLITTTPSGAEGIFVVTNSGSIFSIDPQSLRRSAQPVGTWPNNTLGYLKLRNQLLSLSADGTVLDVSNGKSYEPLAQHQVKAMTKAPFYLEFTPDQSN